LAKRKIIPIEHLSEDIKKLFDVMRNESDLPLILVAASYLDACLASILKRKLKESSVTNKLLEVNGPLGSFSTRSDLCYSLGLIPKKLYQDLQIIAQMRNETAHHHLELNFGDNKVSDLCSKLSYVASLKNGNTEEPLASPEWLEGPRNTFTISTALISQRLLLIGLSIRDDHQIV
jgi:hypothetical protein